MVIESKQDKEFIAEIEDRSDNNADKKIDSWIHENLPKVFWYIKPTSVLLSSKYEQSTEKPTERFSIMRNPKILAKTVPRPIADIISDPSTFPIKYKLMIDGMILSWKHSIRGRAA